MVINDLIGDKTQIILSHIVRINVKNPSKLRRNIDFEGNDRNYYFPISKFYRY